MQLLLTQIWGETTNKAVVQWALLLLLTVASHIRTAIQVPNALLLAQLADHGLERQHMMVRVPGLLSLLQQTQISFLAPIFSLIQI